MSWDCWIVLDKLGSVDRGGRNRALCYLPLPAYFNSKILLTDEVVFEMIRALLIAERRNLRLDFETQLCDNLSLRLDVRDYESLLPSHTFQSPMMDCWCVNSQTNGDHLLTLNVSSSRGNIHWKRFAGKDMIEWLYPFDPILEVLKGLQRGSTIEKLNLFNQSNKPQWTHETIFSQ